MPSGSWALNWQLSASYEDSELAYSLDNVSDIPWQTDNPQSSRGFTRSALWLRLTINNPMPTSTDQSLLIGVPWLDEVDIALVYNREVTEVWQLGDTRPYQPQFFRFLNPHIDLTVPPGRSEIIIRARSKETLVVSPSLQSPLAADRKEIWFAVYLGSLYGALLLFGLYNLFLWISLRDRIYLFYTLFLAAFILGSGSYNGFWYHSLLYASSPWATNIHPHLFLLYQYAGLNFASVFLRTRTDHPGLHKLIRLFIMALVCFHIIYTLAGSPWWGQVVSVAFASLYGLLLLSIALIIFNTRGLTTRLFAWGIFSSVLGTLVATLTVYSVLPFRFTLFHAIELGFVLDATLLSFALAYNLKQLEKDKSVMQMILLSKEQSEKEELEKLVQERTKTLEILAITDQLTQLLNRTGIIRQMEKQFSEYQTSQRAFCLILIDVDFFKEVNDEYGHQTGDRVLRRFSKVVSSQIRAADSCGRWGGEEFLILLPETTRNEARLFAENIRQALKESDLGVERRVSASMGLVEVRREDDMDSLIARADQLLYEAKEQGRDRLCIG